MERKTANISKLPLEQSNSARARYLLFNLPLSTRCSKINGDGHPHSQGKALGNEADTMQDSKQRYIQLVPGRGEYQGMEGAPRY